MASRTLDFHYDQQLRRWVLQAVALFNSFSVSTGKDQDGNPILVRVPALYGDPSRMAAHIKRDNTENKLITIPMIAVYETNIAMAPEMRRVPNHVEHLQVVERQFDSQTGQYNNKRGTSYQVDRFAPVPYKLTINADILTSSKDIKHQLFEQISVLFNPSIDLQSNTNPLDNTALTVMELKNIKWSSRAIPQGIDENLDIMTFEFEIPIHIAPPAKVKKQNIVYTIIQNIGEYSDGAMSDIGQPEPKVITTPGNYCVEVIGNNLKLLGPNGRENDSNGNPYSWAQLFDQYGSLRPDVSQIRTRFTSNIEDRSKDIVGTVNYTNVTNILSWNIDIDTLPQTTINSIDAIIDGHTKIPGNGLPAVQVGQRYMLVGEIPPNTQAWGALEAKENDIIEYNGSNWIVSFDASTQNDEEIVLNKTTNKLYRFDGTNWINAVDGIFNPGWWRICI